MEEEEEEEEGQGQRKEFWDGHLMGKKGNGGGGEGGLWGGERGRRVVQFTCVFARGGEYIGG